MLKRAIMAGLNAVGIDVEDLEVAPVPVTRFIIRRPADAGGLTVRLVAGDPQSVIIRFFDPDGLDLTEDAQRKIERLFSREDFRRVFPGEIGDIGFAPRALEHYATALEATVDIERIRATQFKVVIDYAFGSTSLAMPNVLAKLGLDVLAVNPFISTAGVMGDDLHGNAERVADLVRSSGSHLGAVIDPDGERLLLIDDCRSRAHRHRGVAGVAHAVAAEAERRPCRASGVDDATSRRAAGAVGCERVVDQAVRPRAHGRRGRAGCRLRGKPAGPIHPAGVPARASTRRPRS